MFHEVGYNDVVLLVSLGYTCVDLLMEWDSFKTCSQPIHKWLVISCTCAICFRLIRMLISVMGSDAASTGRIVGGRLGEMLLDVGHKGSMPRALALFTWTTAVPFFALWNFVGTAWLWQVVNETPQCVHTSTHIWFSGLWLLLCHAWLAVYVALGIKAWRLQRQVSSMEQNLRDVEDVDALARWGRVSRVSGSRSLVDVAGRGQGLAPATIKLLPCAVVPRDFLSAGVQRDCPVCLENVEPGDCVRSLPRCGHTFHRSCIDLWLVRSAECPLCKQEVVDNWKEAS